MTLKSTIAKSAGKVTRYLLTKFTNGGSSLPGKIALSIDKNLLANLQNYDVINTGTTVKLNPTLQPISAKNDNIITNQKSSNIAWYCRCILNHPALQKCTG